jgi:hypothetical protein
MERKFLESMFNIRETEPTKADLAFMSRACVQATFPHSDPGDVPIWCRTNGNLTLSIKPDYEIDTKTGKPRNVGLPYGTVCRLLMFWITTEAVKTKSRRIELGESLAAFMRELEIVPTGGRWGTIPRLRDQMNRLFRARISFDIKHGSNGENNHAWVDMQVAPKGELWWSYDAPKSRTLWKSWIELGELFFEAICSAPIPLDMRALKALRKSPLALDLYAWLSYRTFIVTKKGQEGVFISWKNLAAQFGSDYSDISNFKKNIKKVIKKVLFVSPNAHLEFVDGGLVLYPKNSESLGTKDQNKKTPILPLDDGQIRAVPI